MTPVKQDLTTIQIFHPIPVDNLKLLVFDLDGTLADTTVDLSNSMNATLRHFGMEPLPDRTVASFVGNGVPMLLRRSLARSGGIPMEEISDDFLAPYYSFILDEYIAHELDNTLLYPGAAESLNALHEQASKGRWSMAVLTNKPERPAREILAGLGVAQFFVKIYGGDSLPVRKPDPKGLFLLMQQTGATPEQTVMIGDSKTDGQTARNAGAWSLGCAFGYGPQNVMETPPDILVTSAKDWATVLMP
jgi:phosphoglycolate phosphatase